MLSGIRNLWSEREGGFRLLLVENRNITSFVLFAYRLEVGKERDSVREYVLAIFVVGLLLPSDVVLAMIP